MLRGLGVYLLLGVLFGTVLLKSEVISWFRIYEMFRFQSFHMYGIIGSAVLTAAVSLQVIRRLNMRTVNGEVVSVAPKVLGRGTRYWAGGVIFGLGWGIVGACPGPLFALLGSGVSVMIVPLGAALVGTRVYGVARPTLPH
ncbi:MAG: YeeE/YedE family protein [Gemmatimonadota bacterium]|nr:YeeE/YedE family protein [Gemmatimonadota bacterium]